MSRQAGDCQPIVWRLKLNASPQAVFDCLATDEGRERFWVDESRTQSEGVNLWFAAMNIRTVMTILEARPPERLVVRYFGADTAFTLTPREPGGCDLELRVDSPPAHDWHEIHAGWVSALLALKAAVDFDVDLRNHDPARTWSQRYCDN